MPVITEDSSTPAVVWVPSGQSATTASFSPPKNTLCMAATSMTGGTVFQTTPSTKCTDSAGNTWTAATIQQESSGIAVVQFFIHYFSTAPGSITVTFQQTANTVNQAIMLAVRVLNGANSNQTGAGTSNSRHVPTDYNWYWLDDPTTVNSQIYEIVSYLLSTSSPTPYDSNTTTIANDNNGNNNSVFGKAPPTANLTAINIGWYDATQTGATGFAGINLEILPVAASNVTVNLQCAQFTMNAISPVVVIGASTVVNLLTAQFTMTAYPVTATATSVTSGGFGTAGQIKVTYLSPLVEALAYSISPIARADAFGNQLPVGYQGPLSAIEPGSSPALTEFWHQLTLTSANCSASGNGANGFFYQYTPDNEVELIWDITMTGSGAMIGTLPLLYYPLVAQNVITGWYGSGPAAYSATYSPHLFVSQSGVIQLNGFASLGISIFGRMKITLDIL